jgi:hypothetical protein
MEWNRLQANQSRQEISESMFVGSVVICVVTYHSSLVSVALTPISDELRHRRFRTCNGKGQKAHLCLFLDGSFVTSYSPLLERRDRGYRVLTVELHRGCSWSRLGLQ